MKIDLILVYEDPTFGVRGSRKFWAASYMTDPRFTAGYTKKKTTTVATRWGRITQYGTNINVEWLRAQQHKSVPCEDEECAVAFIDKKAKEKLSKGYKVVVHEIDGVNLALLHGTAADSQGYITMRTRSGT